MTVDAAVFLEMPLYATNIDDNPEAEPNELKEDSEENSEPVFMTPEQKDDDENLVEQSDESFVAVGGGFNLASSPAKAPFVEPGLLI